ncbi:MAG TPA: M48 family metallopeptidase [bacterium]|nr:M48 family metallopeptidase [bacterium]
MTVATWIVAVFLVCFGLEQLVEVGLALLNLRHAAAHGGRVPPALEGRVTPETARRSRAYTLVRGRFGLLEQGVDVLVVLAVLFSGLLPWLDGALRGLGLGGAHLFVAYVVVLGALLSVAGLPFRLYSTFGIEARFGFNRMTFAMWVWDRTKALALSAVLGLPLLYGVYGFMATTGRWWWLWVFAFLTAVQIVLQWLYPSVIAPLFNRFTPLPAGSLRERVLALAKRAGFRTRGLYVMDASRRSGHSNAYFAGFFRPRIVLFDTLLERVSEDEALAVLAHEIGHYRKRHVHQALLLNAVASLLLLWAASLLLPWEPLYAAFGFTGPSFHTALALLLLGGGAFTFWLRPLLAWFSRRNEYAADAYAARITGQPAAMASALLRLNEHNLSNLAPHPWYSRFHYSHPTLLERLAALEREAGGSGGIAGGGMASRPAGVSAIVARPVLN